MAMICLAPAVSTVVADGPVSLWRLRRTHYQRALRAYHVGLRAQTFQFFRRMALFRSFVDPDLSKVT